MAIQATPFALILNSLICYLLVPLWRREPQGRRQIAGPPPRGKAVVAGRLGLAGLLGLALAFAWLVLQRPLSYLEALAALVIGYRLLDPGLEEKYWSVILLPGIAALLYLSHTTGARQTYVLMLGTVWVFAVVYLQVSFQYGRAPVRTVSAEEVRAGDVPRNRW